MELRATDFSTFVPCPFLHKKRNSATMTPAMEISTNHHRHAGHEDHTCVELSVDAFTYPDWEADKKSIEKILCKSPSSLADMHARQKLKSMEHKQHMHQGTVVHPGK
jgi:hypothetical protein